MDDKLKAKQHSLLATLKQELNKGTVEETFDMFGFKWTLRVLDENGINWVHNFVSDKNMVAYSETKKAPELAVALRSIDDTPMADMFKYPDSMEPEAQRRLDESPEARQSWIWGQTLVWLNDALDPLLIRQLHKCYRDLEDRRAKALEQLPSYKAKTAS